MLYWMGFQAEILGLLDLDIPRSNCTIFVAWHSWVFFLFVSVCRRLLKNLPIGSNIGFLAPLVRIPSLMTQVLYSVNPWTSSPDSKATIYPRNVADADLPEKFAKELLWLAEKLLDCGGMEEAIQQWSTNPSLAELSLCASPRVQKSLVRLSGISLTLRYLVLNLLH